MSYLSKRQDPGHLSVWASLNFLFLILLGGIDEHDDCQLQGASTHNFPLSRTRSLPLATTTYLGLTSRHASSSKSTGPSPLTIEPDYLFFKAETSPMAHSKQYI
ncbi:hypothetical protein CONPUDRAFT_153014 [Coniophora puteana RWD-64-598 SS2]|uniref:Uncharacterized protein n=1 Tax=Coniophora puteana (strain RWD-64-598) TaxID=741705 RepID=A0A5M3MSI8_CONPW|nr:uncharacterized protein CONPUDRAFT_153014 [Coniophora puteana RWD-64-598 SS2]EIW82129.1 hypothetical protein CONPUDRAFT_153014 [Coniophora puteana RWD-64-598 SS2]